jgi:molybdenum-dependent DNA-binding transcriptional regulator ModE
MMPITEPTLNAEIFKILEASEKAKSVQEIADEVKISYAAVMEHLAAIGTIVQLRHETLTDGIHRVEIFRVRGTQ